MAERTPLSIAVAWLSREDLLYCRPDLENEIEALDDAQLIELASQVSDALQEAHHLTMFTILSDYLAQEGQIRSTKHYE